MTRVACEIVDAYVYRRTATGPEFLVARRAPTQRLGGTWQAIHGRIEAGETAWQAALREIQEETGLTPSAFFQVDTVNTFYVASDDTVYHCPCFAAEVAPDAEVRLNEEHDAFEWLPVESAMARYPWPGQRRAVREILAEIITPGPATEHLRIRL